MSEKQKHFLEIIPEICCDVCNEIIHNHIEECPVCKANNARTDYYMAFYDEYKEGDEVIISCEECDTKFKRIYDNFSSMLEGEWEIVEGEQ